MKPFRLTRRTILRGAGASIALPVLDAMLTDSGLLHGVAHAQASPVPTRLVTLFCPNGVHMPAWWPKAGASPSTYTVSTLLAALDTPFATGVRARDFVNVLGGIDYANGGGHSAVRFLTGDPDISRCGPSVDQVVAQKLPAGTTRLRSIVVSAEAQVPDADHGPNRLYTAWSGSNKPVEFMVSSFANKKPSDPAALFKLVFPSVATAPSQEPDHQKSVLDAVKADAMRLHSRLGGEDRMRLEAHLTAIRELELELFSPTVNACTQLAEPPATPKDGRDRAALLLDVIALALKCDVTRVANFSFGPGMSGFRHAWLPNGSGHSDHGWSHLYDDEAGGMEYRLAVARARVEMFVALLKRLWEVQEGDRRLLDNTLLYFGNEASQVHSLVDQPILLAGGAGGLHKTGRYLRYPSGTRQGDLLVSILNLMGHPVNTFGTRGKAPLPSLT